MSRFMRYNGTIIKPGSGSRLPPMPTIRDIIKMQNLKAFKQLSQNFIMDEQLTARIVKQCGKLHNYNVLEVGPGSYDFLTAVTSKQSLLSSLSPDFHRIFVIVPIFIFSNSTAVGNITRSILRSGPKQLVVVEKDRRFIPTLEALSAAVKPAIKMDVYRDDILKFNIEHAFPEAKHHDWMGDLPPMYLIGNLPFAISTRLLVNWLKDISLQRGAWSFGRTGMVLMFQYEVGQRIIAPISNEQRCRLSVMSQIWTKPIMRFTLPGRVFMPKPDVDVAIVRFTPLKEPLTKLPFDLVEMVMRILFSMRQKQIKRPIADLYPPELKAELTERTITMAQVSPLAKCYQLSNEECVRIAQAYSDILAEYPLIANYDSRGQKPRRYNVNALTQSDVMECDEYEDCR